MGRGRMNVKVLALCHEKKGNVEGQSLKHSARSRTEGRASISLAAAAAVQKTLFTFLSRWYAVTTGNSGGTRYRRWMGGWIHGHD